jgi:hypothetical protein
MHSQPKMQFLKLRSNGSQSISLAGAQAETLGAEADDFATRVSIRALHYLIALAECLNFARATNSCAVPQPNLSIQVRKLEEYLGVKIFERNCARVAVTVGNQLSPENRTARLNLTRVSCSSYSEGRR